MADDFYTMQEVMEKLRKSEPEVQNLVKEGRLRQYMDGGKPMFKAADIDELAEEIVGLDISSVGMDLGGSALDLGESALDLGGSELDLDLDMDLEEVDETEPAAADERPAESDESQLNLAETAEIELEADDEPEEKPAKKAESGSADDLDLKDQSSEGGFGLSQMGDLTMADTNVGTVGINILSGTEDAFKLTEDTKAETMSADVDDDELDSLDADSNMESFGSGSGLLDLSLQADDTSLGAVLDDILPAGAEDGGGDLPIDQIEPGDEAEDLLAEPAMGPAASAAPVAGGAAPMTPAQQMVAVAAVDPRTNLFGIAMFLPLAAIIMVGIVLTAAMQGVDPSLMKMLTNTKIADIGLFWYILGGMALLAVLFSLFASVGGGSGGSGGGGGGGTAKAKTKAPKAKKEKKPKKKKK